jgi:autotransporter-associated beta strand protein
MERRGACTRAAKFWLLKAWVLLAATAIAGRTSAATFSWAGQFDGNWATLVVFPPFGSLSNWSSGGLPPSASSTELDFNTSPEPVLTNNLGNPFVLNRLVLSVSITLNGSPLQFVSDGATTPTIQVSSSPQIANALSLSNPTAISGGGTLQLGGAITGAGSLADGVPTTLSGGSVSLTGPVTFTSPLTLAANTTLSSGGNISLSTVDGNFAIALNSAATTSLGPVGSSTPSLSLATDSAGTTTLNNLVRTTGAQTYNDAVTLGTTTTVNSTGGSNILFAKTIDGAPSLTVNTSGSTTFNGAIGLTTAPASLTTDVGGTTALNGGTVRTAGPQTYFDAVTLGAATTLASTGAGNITLNSTLSGPFDLTVNTAGTTKFAGAVTGGFNQPISVTTDAAGSTTLQASVSTSGAQTYNDPVTLAANANLTSNTAAITFGGTLNGNSSLGVSCNAGTATFGAAVGGTTPLASLTLSVKDASGGAVTAGSIEQTSGLGTTTFTGTLHSTGASGIALSGKAFSLAALQSDNGPISITNTAASTVSGVVSTPAAFTKMGGGVLTLSAANTYTGNTLINGTLRVTGSIAASAAVQVNGKGTFDAAAGQTVQSLSIATLGTAIVSADALKVGVDAATVPLSISTGGSNTGVLDLTTHGLIVDVTPAQESAARDTVRAYVVSGFNGGDWHGAGIVSAAAAADSTKAVGYALASEVLGAGGGTFLNVTVDGSAAVARFTFLGDATLDGKVDFTDLVKLAQNYNIVDGSRLWFTGDFNYDGNVDFADLVKLAQNYNAALPGEPIPGARPGFESDLRAAFATVPEPLTPAWLVTALVLMTSRRRAGAHIRGSDRT